MLAVAALLTSTALGGVSYAKCETLLEGEYDIAGKVTADTPAYHKSQIVGTCKATPGCGAVMRATKFWVEDLDNYGSYKELGCPDDTESKCAVYYMCSGSDMKSSRGSLLMTVSSTERSVRSVSDVSPRLVSAEYRGSTPLWEDCMDDLECASGICDQIEPWVTGYCSDTGRSVPARGVKHIGGGITDEMRMVARLGVLTDALEDLTGIKSARSTCENSLDNVDAQGNKCMWTEKILGGPDLPYCKRWAELGVCNSEHLDMARCCAKSCDAC